MSFVVGNAYASHPGEFNGNFKHGLRHTSEYKAFHSAKQRCSNPNNPRFKDWGGRGIKFLLPSIESLIERIGKKPSKEYSLDRINNFGDYTLDNVKWSTKQEQRLNSRPAKNIPLRDKKTGRFFTQEKTQC